MDKNQEISIQTQQKFEFYFLALVFTVLGLSIQTSAFSSRLQSVVEITAWVFLLISGLAGLSRMEWVPPLYGLFSELTEQESFVKEAKSGRPLVRSGQSLSEVEAKEHVRRVENGIGKRTDIMHKIEARSKVKYFLHKWMFVAGLVLLVVSRAINLCCCCHASVGQAAAVLMD